MRGGGVGYKPDCPVPGSRERGNRVPNLKLNIIQNKWVGPKRKVVCSLLTLIYMAVGLYDA